MEGLERVCVHFEADFPLEGKVPFGRGNGGVESGKALFRGGVLAFLGKEEAREDVIEGVNADEVFDIRELEGGVSFLRLGLG